MLSRGLGYPLRGCLRRRNIAPLAAAVRQQRLASTAALTGEQLEVLNEPREAMEYDVVIVGGGPAGLATAIRLRQLSEETGTELSVCMVEKGGTVGAHILSGNVFEPRALDELLPGWEEMGAPTGVAAGSDSLKYLTEKYALPLPTPPTLQNHGNRILSLGHLCAWMGEKAEELGVEIYPGFAASEVIYTEDGAVKGIATSDVGIGERDTQRDTHHAELYSSRRCLLRCSTGGSNVPDKWLFSRTREGQRPERPLRPRHGAARAAGRLRGGLPRLMLAGDPREVPAARGQGKALPNLILSPTNQSGPPCTISYTCVA
jgi:hypothetical protein